MYFVVVETTTIFFVIISEIQLKKIKNRLILQWVRKVWVLVVPKLSENEVKNGVSPSEYEGNKGRFRFCHPDILFILVQILYILCLIYYLPKLF